MSVLESKVNEEIPEWLKGKKDILSAGILKGDTITYMSSEIGVKYQCLRNYMIERGFHSDWRESRFLVSPNNARGRKFLKLIKTGGNHSEIAHRLHISIGILQKYFSSNPTLHTRWKYERDKRKKRRMMNTHPEVLRAVASDNPPSIDSLVGMVDSWKFKSQPWDFLNRRGLLEEYRKKRRSMKEIKKVKKKRRSMKERKKEKDFLRKLIVPILEHAEAREQSDSYLEDVVKMGAHVGIAGSLGRMQWAHRAANVWRVYDTLLSTGEKITLSKIGRIVGIEYHSVGNILERLRIGREAAVQRRIPLSPTKKEVVKRTVSEHLDVPIADLAYFLQTEPHVIYNYRGMISATGKTPGKGWHGISLRLSSQVYECLEETHFLYKEIAEFVDCSVGTVERAKRGRSHYEPKIKSILKTTYKQRKLDVPYLTPEDRLG